ncbi:hypothetical protein I3F58_04775 [Streptomyces sp. MUM 203J]|uniref:hypothetical protein n=1 Tax=Streptomyces sp. MUM 203J TaxID=2791990 RepID=UPI001F038EE0|nr:hypothetical protein [Streptomyces sp. MUM 203J]MCH0538879.1 hypothetical protein [Streptomyces sp. MUM 203J]
MPRSAPPFPVRVLAVPGERHDETPASAAPGFAARLAGSSAERGDRLPEEPRRGAARPATGAPLGLPDATAAVRADASRQAPPAPGLTGRRGEGTGPPGRRTAVGTLGSGARGRTADFEDAAAPTRGDVSGGQPSLLDAVERRIGFTAPKGGKQTGPVTEPPSLLTPSAYERHLVRTAEVRS